IDYLKEKQNVEYPNSYIPKEKIQKFVADFFEEKILIILNIIKKNRLSNLPVNEIPFPENDMKISLSKYLKNFENAEYYSFNNEKTILEKFDLEKINSVMEKFNLEKKYLILIDEFEEKYSEISKIVESGGGGPLRQFYEDISNGTTDFYMIIGCGPISGYEMLSQYSAESGRISKKQIPFPHPNKLSENFLKNQGSRGYCNFIWWVSRARPGHIKRLRDAFGNLNTIENISYSEFIENFSIINENIDEQGGSDVSYLKKTEIEKITENLGVRTFIKNLLVSIESKEYDDIKSISKKFENLNNYIDIFYTSKQKISVDYLVESLMLDIKNYIKTPHFSNSFNEEVGSILNRYFYKLLVSIADKNNEIAFGYLDVQAENMPNKVIMFRESFIKPVFYLIQDYISIFEDDIDPNIKLCLDVISEIINIIVQQTTNIKSVFKNTFDYYKQTLSDNIDAGEKFYIQSGLKLIRDVIEQPIGSSELPYKNENLKKFLPELKKINTIVGYSKTNHKINSLQLDIIIIPDLDENLIKMYNKKKKIYVFQENWIQGKEYFFNGNKVLSFIYLGEKNNNIIDFENYIQSDDKKLLFDYKKISIKHISEFKLSRNLQITNFLNSLIKIVLIADNRKEQKFKNLTILENIYKIIISDKWTIRKEKRRTIDFYWDLMNKDFEKTILNTLTNDFKSKIKEKIDFENKQKFNFDIDILLFGSHQSELEQSKPLGYTYLMLILLEFHKNDEFRNFITTIKNHNKIFSSNDFHLFKGIKKIQENYSAFNINDFNGNTFLNTFKGFTEEVIKYEKISFKKILEVMKDAKNPISLELIKNFYDSKNYSSYLLRTIHLNSMFENLNSKEKEKIINKYKTITESLKNSLRDQRKNIIEINSTLNFIGIKTNRVSCRLVDIYSDLLNDCIKILDNVTLVKIIIVNDICENLYIKISEIDESLFKWNELVNKLKKYKEKSSGIYDKFKETYDKDELNKKLLRLKINKNYTYDKNFFWEQIFLYSIKKNEVPFLIICGRVHSCSRFLDKNKTIFFAFSLLTSPIVLNKYSCHVLYIEPLRTSCSIVFNNPSTVVKSFSLYLLVIMVLI
ncbi:MAG: hypothetical protein ACMXX8_02075, partial [Candidatus Woesearchaeota archaeon]